MKTYLVLLLIVISSCSVYEKKSTVTYQNYEGGEIKSYLKLTTISSKEISLYDHYNRWDVEYVVYDENGKPLSKSVQKYKNASSGRPCHELISIYIEYYSSGKLKYYQKDRCDCKSSVIKSYNSKGKLLYKTRSHQKRIE